MPKAGTGVRIAEKRERARASGDPYTALAYTDAELQAFPEQLSPYYAGLRERLRVQRRADFEAVVEAELKKVGPLSAANAEKHFAVALTLRAEARRGPEARVKDLAPVIESRLDGLVTAAADELWKQVDAAAASGELSRAVLLGETIARVAPSPARTDALATLRAQARDLHIAEAAKVEPAHFGARIVHERLAALYANPTERAKAADESQLAAAATIAWTTSVTGECDQLPARITDSYRSGGGIAAKLTVAFTSCTVAPEPLAPITEKMQYVETVMVKEQVQSYQAKCYLVRDWGNDEARQKPNGDWEVFAKYKQACDAPKKDFHGDTVEVERQVLRTEDVTIELRQHVARATGTIRIESDGFTRDVALDGRGVSPPDRQFTHKTASETFDDRSGALQAKQALEAKILLQLSALEAELLQQRAEQFVKAAASAQGAAAVHAHVLAATLRKQATPAFVQLMQSTYKVEPVLLEAAIDADKLPSHKIVASHTLELPAISEAEINNERAMDVYQGVWSQGRRSALIMSFLAGFGSATNAMESSSGGVVGSFSLTGMGQFIALGFRMGGGYITNGSSLFDIDLIAGGGLRLRAFTAAAIVGVGGSFTPRYDAATASPEGFGLPGAGYVEYGARVAYAFSFPVTVEGIYTKVFRSSDALQRERRIDGRLQLRLAGKPLAFGLRYAEFLPDSDPFFATFGSGTIAGKSLWVMGGFGF